jgi:methyltransferase (TIGR00027 family)
MQGLNGPELKRHIGIDDADKVDLKTHLKVESKIKPKRKGPSIMAEGIGLHRVVESAKPEGERICYDPYAIRFIRPEFLEAFKDPAKAKAAHEQYERLFPGFGNSVRARVRFFDDFVKTALDEGIEQLVTLGAGYDTRAYRIEGLKGRAKVFEMDRPETLQTKMGKIKEIFGSLPDHVVYVPVDFHVERLGQRLMECGYNKSLKTLFVMEGLVMSLPLVAVDDILAFVIENSGKGSAILFDYFTDSVIKGTCDAGRNMKEFAENAGELLQFGIEKGEVEIFLAQRGFSKIHNVTSDDYKRVYFHGINEGRPVCSLLYFAHAVVE